MASASDDGNVHVFHCTVYSDLTKNPMIVPLKERDTPEPSLRVLRIFEFFVYFRPFLPSSFFFAPQKNLFFSSALRLQVLRGHGVVGGKGVLDTVFHPRQPWLFTAGADGVICLFQDV